MSFYLPKSWCLPKSIDGFLGLPDCVGLHDFHFNDVPIVDVSTEEGTGDVYA